MGQHLSFYKLFTEKGLSVEIPIIQRDYAQGRSSEQEIRNNFSNSTYLNKYDEYSIKKKREHISKKTGTELSLLMQHSDITIEYLFSKNLFQELKTLERDTIIGSGN